MELLTYFQIHSASQVIRTQLIYKVYIIFHYITVVQNINFTCLSPTGDCIPVTQKFKDNFISIKVFPLTLYWVDNLLILPVVG